LLGSFIGRGPWGQTKFS